MKYILYLIFQIFLYYEAWQVNWKLGLALLLVHSTSNLIEAEREEESARSMFRKPKNLKLSDIAISMMKNRENG